MSSVLNSAQTFAMAMLALFALGAGSAEAAALRVCADPNNLPFSNLAQEGFENTIADLVAKYLGRTVQYTWWPQRRGFIRNTLRANKCDVVMGVPVGYELTETTRPYYRSSYVFVTRADRELNITSFDDPRLAKLRIGVHVIGDDYNNPPPVQALAERGLDNNVRGYRIYGDYSQPNPPRGLIDAVARGEVDVAIAWGPIAGYFATREPTPLKVSPVSPSATDRLSPMRFAIAMGVRRGDGELKSALEKVLERHQTDIEEVLVRYGVPLF